MNSSTDTGGPSPASLKKHTFAHRVAAVFPWAMGFWLIVMTGWYVATVVNSLHHPMNTGDDLVWARWWVCLAVAIVLSHLLVRRRLVTLIWLVLLSATAISMIILSQHVTAALITAWLLLLSWAWGDFLLRKIGVPPSGRILERIALAVPLGLALIGLVALVLCMTRFLGPKWAWLSLLILTLAQWRSLRQLLLNFHRWITSDRPFAATAPISPDVGILVAFMGFVFLLDLSWALAPEIHFDALAAHLPVAQNYVEHPVGLLSYGYIANFVNLLFALAMSLQGQAVAKLMVLASSVLAALGVYTLGQMFLSSRVGLWAAALFFTTPLVSWLATTTYIDAVVTMFLASALLAFFRWQEDRERGWLWACGLLTGAAIAAKLNALLGLPVVGLLLLWYVIRSRQSVRERLKGFAGYILGVVLVAAPGYSIAYALTGNPFYPLPLFDKLFKSSAGPSVNLISNSNLFGIGTSPTALLKLPMALTFDTTKFGEALPEGGVGLALILVPLALPLLIKIGRAHV